MKSTIKIAGQSQAPGLVKPVIKIVQPHEVVFKDDYGNHIGDDDSRDELINIFLQNPCNCGRNDWFTVDTNYPIPFNEKPTHYITTIGAVDERDLFFRFMHAILNRVVPYEDIVKINREQIAKHSSVEKHNKITEFFAWIDEVGYCSWEERQPTDHDGRPRN